eukprot:CAMPEP_0197522058 /NCGR_PEP_ID=MMETSP1318-20131121/7253_1 /TAXON_ID=552666 /ORGANISM="Partenskyella glossopodia, Strain RCC365" /LENGTH=290 /DNA_ID=CAMNT_0043074279 /DNA_START=167 /DNA_END=1035 /DNA_ORIENTATION=-
MPLGRRIAEAFGGTKTVDEKFDNLEKKILDLEKQLKGFKKIVGVFMSNLKSFQTTTVGTAAQLQAYYESDPEEPMAEFFSSLGAMYRDSLENKYPLLVKNVEERVTSAMEKFQAEVSVVKRRVKERKEARLLFDHYKHKLDGLRKEKEKVTVQGKLAGWKNKEKFHRNEKKFSDAKNNYEHINNAVFDEMWKLYSERFTHINGFSAAFIKMQIFYFSAYGKQNAMFLGPLKQALANTKKPIMSPRKGMSSQSLMKFKDPKPPSSSKPEEKRFPDATSPKQSPNQKKNDSP